MNNQIKFYPDGGKFRFFVANNDGSRNEELTQYVLDATKCHRVKERGKKYAIRAIRKLISDYSNVSENERTMNSLYYAIVGEKIEKFHALLKAEKVSYNDQRAVCELCMGNDCEDCGGRRCGYKNFITEEDYHER
jgi:hypothetical protein